MPNWDEVFKKKPKEEEKPKRKDGKRPKMVTDEILDSVDRHRPIDLDNY